LTQQLQHIEWIPISEIRIANPRARNKITFQNIVVNIGNVGLKKPITVCRREPAADGTAYDLACGQGRIEALVALGESKVPAIVIEANKEQRHLISLVENIARRRPSNTELVREVRNLTDRGYSPSSIADKLGLHITYINNVVRLLRKGEDKLIAEVEAGTLPLSVAVKIAGASSKAVQKALNDAYESGDLRGGKFRAVQKLIARRFAKTRSDPAKAKAVSSKDIVREYQKQTQRQVALVRRAAIVAQRLALLRSAMKRLLSDDHFVTLLRAESLDRLPEALAKRSA
jgi:ParB family transcriptional regulator, chromosome partitioning protein